MRYLNRRKKVSENEKNKEEHAKEEKQPERNQAETRDTN